MSWKQYTPRNGFTLLELAIVIILIGILSAVVMINIQAVAQHSVTVQAETFKRTLAHIQLLSISQSHRLRLSVNASGTNYSVVSCTTSACTTTNTLIDPATGANFNIALTDGVTLSPTSNNLDFDSLGRPQFAGSLIASNPARTYTLAGNGRSVRITVSPITGFAQMTY